jgi:hypothetical protein
MRCAGGAHRRSELSRRTSMIAQKWVAMANDREAVAQLSDEGLAPVGRVSKTTRLLDFLHSPHVRDR